jgi:cobalt-zinc-cadmium efflux system protein
VSEAHAHDHGTHAHGSPGHVHAHAPASDAVALRRALALTLGVLIVEAVGGFLTNSVALLADAGHMLTDAGALAIALFAAWASTRPRRTRHSFGYGRAEVLAALLNGLLLGGVSVGVAAVAQRQIGDDFSRRGAKGGEALFVAAGIRAARCADSIALAVSRAKPADPQEYQRLHNLVEGLCIAAGLLLGVLTYQPPV